jgi:hypothetical protein
MVPAEAAPGAGFDAEVAHELDEPARVGHDEHPDRAVRPEPVSDSVRNAGEGAGAHSRIRPPSRNRVSMPSSM